jgi:hypothetical protein
MNSIDEDDMLDKEQDEIDDTIKEMQDTESKIETLQEAYRKVHDKSSKRRYELARLRKAMEGARLNLTELSSCGKPLNALGPLLHMRASCVMLSDIFQKEKQDVEFFGRVMDGFTKTESLSANATQMLYGSTFVFENNATDLHLNPVPPSVREKIDPYSEDQPAIVEELRELLKSISPELENLYSAAKEIFEPPARARLEAAATNLRTLIWEIYRTLAPDEKVIAAQGFKAIKGDPTKATYRQKIAYILTGTDETDGSDANLIETVFGDLNEALKVFSAKTKTISNTISDYQLTKTMAQCERALLSLLKNRKV